MLVIFCACIQQVQVVAQLFGTKNWEDGAGHGAGAANPVRLWTARPAQALLCVECCGMERAAAAAAAATCGGGSDESDGFEYAEVSDPSDGSDSDSDFDGARGPEDLAAATRAIAGHVAQLAARREARGTSSTDVGVEGPPQAEKLARMEAELTQLRELKDFKARIDRLKAGKALAMEGAREESAPGLAAEPAPVDAGGAAATAALVTGGCQCGSVRYSMASPAKNTYHCHCLMCRKLHGALFATFSVCAKTAWVLEKGRLTVFDSSPGVTCQFCGKCGCQILSSVAESEQHPRMAI